MPDGKTEIIQVYAGLCLKNEKKNKTHRNHIIYVLCKDFEAILLLKTIVFLHLPGKDFHHRWEWL